MLKASSEGPIDVMIHVWKVGVVYEISLFEIVTFVPALPFFVLGSTVPRPPFTPTENSDH